MHPTLLTQLLGKVGEAWLTHAKANNLPKLLGASSAELVLCWWWFYVGGQLLERGGETAHCNPEDELQPQPVSTTGVLLACLC